MIHSSSTILLVFAFLAIILLQADASPQSFTPKNFQNLNRALTHTSKSAMGRGNNLSSRARSEMIRRKPKQFVNKAKLLRNPKGKPLKSVFTHNIPNSDILHRDLKQEVYDFSVRKLAGWKIFSNSNDENVDTCKLTEEEEEEEEESNINNKSQLALAFATPVAGQNQVVKPSPPKANPMKEIPPILAAAFTAAAVMYPVDLLRSLKMANAGGPPMSTLQLVSEFKNNFGISGFFTQGLVPEVSRATWMRGVKFSLFPLIHYKFFGREEKNGSPATLALSAIITSIPEVISIMPLECAKITLTMDSTKSLGNSMLKAMGKVKDAHGIGGFMIGYLGIQYRQAAWSAVYFASVPFFRKKVAVGFEKAGIDIKKNKNARVLAQLTSGFAAGVFGAMFNTPGDTIRSVVQKRIFAEPSIPATFFGVGKEIIQTKGVGALYAGFGFKAVHLGGGGALMAFLIPMFKGVFERAEKKKSTSP